MKISGSSDLSRPGVGGADKPRESRPAKPADGGSVSISDLAAKLQSLESDLATNQPFDSARVEEIKQAIRDGRFKVNAEVVADRLIESMKELLSRK